MNFSHNPQIPVFSRLFCLGALLWGQAVSAYSPDAEAVLERLRDQVAGGLAGRESYDAFLDFLGDGGSADADCGAWADMVETQGRDLRWREIRQALAAICPEAVRPGGAKGRLAIAQSARPRQDPQANNAFPAPTLSAEGSLPGAAARLTLRDYRLDARVLRIGTPRLHILAGQMHADLRATRLAFVAGSRFYAGWSGGSGLAGPLASPQAALDGLGAHARLGKWIWEGAGAWNRLRHGSAASVQPRNDALLYQAGTARSFRAGTLELEFKAQAVWQRFEPESGPAAEIAVAGAALAHPAETGWHWRLGLAASLAPDDGAPKAAPDLVRGIWGGYAEAAMGARGEDSAAWELQARQADAAWANPLQSPRGYLRDTLAGRWILAGRGEGGLSARTFFPLAARSAYRVGLQTGGAADWGPEGVLAGEGSLAAIQTYGAWTHEAGITAAFLRAAASTGSGFAGSLGRGGWGQSLAWTGRAWSARGAFVWKGGEYSGLLPAPLSLEIRGVAAAEWSAAFTTGDIREPGAFLRCDLNQGWEAGKGVRVRQTLRLPWARRGLASDLGYQLRLTVAL